MIILDDRGWTMQQMILKNKEQIQGSQTWLDDIPGGLHTRCHYYDGRFSVENYMEIGISPIGLAKSHYGMLMFKVNIFQKKNGIVY